MCKYRDCLASAGGGFSKVTIVDGDGDYAYNADIAANAWTYPRNNVEFGKIIFNSENFAASTIGHELRHTADPWYSRPKKNAYQWELDHAGCTGIGSADVDRIKKLIAK